MEELIQLLFAPFLIALVISFCITSIVIKLAPMLKIVDYPGKRGDPATLHTQPVPRGGGIPIFLSILGVCLLFLPIDQRLTGILIGAAVVTSIGFIDDRRNSSPYLRLVGQFLAAGVVVASGVGISFVTNPLTGNIIDLSYPRLDFVFLGIHHSIWILSTLFGLLWIVFLMNAVSMSSGVDGQLSGFTAIAAGVLAALSLKFSADITQWPVTILASAVSGAFLGFLSWHAYPQKIMPGFGGGTLAGFMLAILSILSAAKVGTLLVVLAIPIADTVYAITRRLHSGKSPVWGDKKHLHHRLLEAGWSKRQVAIFYWTATAVLGVLALTLNTVFKFYTIIGAGLFVGGLLLWLISLSQSSKQQDQGNG